MCILIFLVKRWSILLYFYIDDSKFKRNKDLIFLTLKSMIRDEIHIFLNMKMKLSIYKYKDYDYFVGLKQLIKILNK